MAGFHHDTASRCAKCSPFGVEDDQRSPLKLRARDLADTISDRECEQAAHDIAQD
jgi:hypothetical protein